MAGGNPDTIMIIITGFIMIITSPIVAFVWDKIRHIFYKPRLVKLLEIGLIVISSTAFIVVCWGAYT